MNETFARWDAAEELVHHPEDAAMYLEACIDEDPGDGSVIRAALNDIARAQVCRFWPAAGVAGAEGEQVVEQLRRAGARCGDAHVDTGGSLLVPLGGVVLARRRSCS